MFARVLFVGSASYGAADFGWRLCDALIRKGHAVQSVSPALGICAIERVCLAFDPTLIVWDGKSAPPAEEAARILGERSCMCALLGEGDRLADARMFDAFDCVIDMAWSDSDCPSADSMKVGMRCRPDERYCNAVASNAGSEKRGGVLCLQALDAERLDDIERALEVSGETRLVAREYAARTDRRALGHGENVAFHARSTALFVAFDGADAPGCIDFAMRSAEGNILVVEDSLASRLPEGPMRNALRVFKRGALASAAADLSCEDTRREAARQQRDALDALPFLDEALDELLQRLDAKAVSSGKDAVLSRAEAAANVVLFGWFGMDNLGDDLLMRSVARRVTEAFENASIGVIGYGPSRVIERYGFGAVFTGDKYAVKHLLENAHAVVYCGGLIFDEPLASSAGEIEFQFDSEMDPTCQASTSLLARVHGVPSFGLGIGAGPVSLAATRRSVGLMALSGMRFLARDQNTANLLLAAGAPSSQVDLRADLIFGEKKYLSSFSRDRVPYARMPDSPYCVVALRDWSLNGFDLPERVAAAIDAVVEESDLEVVLLPFDAEDVSIHRKVQEHVAHRCRCMLFDEKPSDDEILAIMAGSSLAFAMRLHCSIIHHVLGKPAVGLNYNDKVEAHYRVVGQTDYLLALDAGADAMASAVLSAYRSADAIAGELADSCAQKARLVDEAYDELYEAIRNAREAKRDAGQEVETFYPRTVSRQDLKIAAQREEIERLAYENESIRIELQGASDRLERMALSKSYRIGRALVAPFSKARSLFGRDS